MRTAGVLLVLVAARVAVLAGRSVTVTWWSSAAYLWQDAAVVLAFSALDLALRRRPRLAWTAYALVVMYVAVNVPVARALSTPLTLPMWKAARGPLSDSLWYYVTPANVWWMAGLLITGLFAPRCFRRISTLAIAAAVVPLVAIGPAAASRVDTHGWDRNAWTALAITAVPRVTARASSPQGIDWRATEADDSLRTETASAALPDLTRLRGAAAGRNVVIVSLESTAAQYLGLYGAEPDVAPNLSSLARHAVVFQHAYAVYPESIRGLFSVLCSTYPSFDRSADSYAAVPCQSVAAELSARGYRTALFHSGRFGYLGMDAVIRNRGYDRLADAGDIGGHRESSFGVDEPSTVARILDWLDGLRAGDRFFVTYLPIAGHHPYESPNPERVPERTEFDRYRNALRYSDAALGVLARGLRERGLDEQTVWVVFGDHGEAFGQHDGNYGHTFQLYDENVRVPMLVAAPALIGSQVRAPQIVSLIDVAPTVLDLVGLPAPRRYQGRSMLDGERRMALFFADYSLGLLGLRDGRMKYIYELESGRSRLFDVATDPAETHDLSGRHADAVRRYAQDLKGWSAAQKDLLER